MECSESQPFMDEFLACGCKRPVPGTTTTTTTSTTTITTSNTSASTTIDTSSTYITI